MHKSISLIVLVILLNGCGGGGGGSSSQLTPIPAQENNSSETLDPNTNIFIPKETFETPEYRNQWGLDFINACGINNKNARQLYETNFFISH